MVTKSGENLLFEKEFYSTNKGVTLIEMLAAVAIFSIIVGAVSGLFISGIQAQRRVLATQEILDQTSYVLEYMGRALRMAKKELETDSTKACLRLPETGTPVTALTGWNYQDTNSRDIGGVTYEGPGIKFKNSYGICQEFFWHSIGTGADNQLKEWKSGSGYTEPLPLIAEIETVEAFNVQFILSGQSQTDDLQPRVTIFLYIESARISQSPPIILIQTSISQRSLDVQY